jgi:SAM-dependent methyltransferase
MAISCPACHSETSDIEMTVTAGQAAQHFVLREADPARNAELRGHIAAMWNGDSADLRHCQACGFGFAWPFIGGDEQFYSLAFGVSGYPRYRWEFDRTLRAIAGRSYANALEVGAGRGAFLERLSPAFVPSSGVLALEYNADARDELAGRGYRVAGADFRSLETDEKFDLICSFQVLEHLDSPDEAFGAIARLLAPRGRAFVSVPNNQRTAWSHRHGGLIDMPPNHIGRWTTAAFRTVAERHRLRVVDSEVAPNAAREFIAADLINSFLRRAQRGGTVANRLAARSRRAKQAGAMLYAPLRLPRSLAGVSRAGGVSLWVELEHG